MDRQHVFRVHPAWNYVVQSDVAEMWDLRSGSRVRITAPGDVQSLIAALHGGVTAAAWEEAIADAGLAPAAGRQLLGSMIGRGIVDAVVDVDGAPTVRRGPRGEVRGRTDPLLSFLEHYSGQNGTGAQLIDRMRTATVLVFGLGGSGSWLVLTLAMLGVGRIIGIDSDVVEASNLGRQALYRPADCGRPKARVVHEQLTALNPDISFVAVERRIRTPEEFGALLDGVDLVALPFAYIGLHPSRDLAARACVAHDVPFLPFGLRAVGPLWESTGTPCYRCLLPDPRKGALRAAATGRCTARLDELTYLPWLAAAANRAADEIVRALTGFLPPLTAGRVQYTALDGTVECRTGPPLNDCPICAPAEGHADVG